MNEHQIVVFWCQNNNWTEPRQLENGIWVAFPPNGVIETPISSQTFCSPKQKKSFPINIFFSTVLLLLCAVGIGMVAVCIAPYFWLQKIINES